MDLTEMGFLARVQCAEVWTSMAPAFYKTYLESQDFRDKERWSVMNSNKFRTGEFLIRYHEQRGDKILVFSDDLRALQMYVVFERGVRECHFFMFQLLHNKLYDYHSYRS